MARSKTTWKKGQSGNPNGQPRVPIKIKEIRKLTLKEYCELVDKFIHASPQELKEMVNDPDATVLELYIANIVKKGIEGGDTNRLSFLLDRLIGPVKQKLDMTSDGSLSSSSTIIVNIPDNGRDKISEDEHQK
jgi:Family of unknown function (DUF5681)